MKIFRIVITVLICGLILWRAHAYDQEKAKKDQEAKDAELREVGEK